MLNADFDPIGLIVGDSSPNQMSPQPQLPSKQALYIEEPGDTAKIAASDIMQGHTGDCFLLAVLDEIAVIDPWFIASQIISPNGDGTETVTLYQDAEGGAPTYQTRSLVAEPFQVTNKFSAKGVNNYNYNTNDIVNGVKEIWPQVIEKAYAEEVGGFNVINQGGSPADAMEALTGQKASTIPAQSLTLDTLNSLTNIAGSLITFDTSSAPSGSHLPFNLVGDHVYAFDGLEQRNGQTFVDLINPWGIQQPAAIPFSKIASNFNYIDHGTV